MLSKLLAVVLLATAANAIPIDNGLQGEPEVECLGDSIQVNFNARNPWEGNLYVKGLFADDGCKVKGTGTNQLASIKLGFDSCNVQRQRSLEPRGVFVHVTLVLGFHPIFLTKVDRAFRIQCFYMEADKTVSEALEVSGITTGFATFNLPMPVCRYDIRETSAPDSNPVQFALIGQSVYHHWICDTDTVDTFCMRVYDCKVDDGTGAQVIQLIDENGCALDRNLLDNLEYPEDLRAVKESHVFKYADVPNTQYECQIEITVKDPGSECARPVCGQAPATRGKRSPDEPQRSAGSMDVSPQKPLFIADLDLTEADVPAALLRRHNEPHRPHYAPVVPSAGEMCASSTAVIFVAALLVLAFSGTVTVIAILYTRRSK